MGRPYLPLSAGAGHGPGEGDPACLRGGGGHGVRRLCLPACLLA